ncbi:MAG: sodium-dependent transporter [Planctomycetes bacterium]|nr:sodium-dependent transporter [Planctomycetota bacterium]
MADLIREEQRENWGSRAGFILAAIGSAVGLGNLWGFPYKVYAHGGGAFLIPYIIAMVIVGIPMLILEFSLGHMTQRAAPDAYRAINRKTEPIGWWAILLGFVIITYYPVILAYCGSFLIECIKGVIYHSGELAWKGKGLAGVNDHFYHQYLQMWTEKELASGVKPWAFGKLVSPIVISLAVIWILMYLCIFRGVRAVSKVVMLTVPLPWIMLLILTIRGLTLPGAARGLNFYLDPKWSELAKPETWRWAFGQMFFSMSLAFGVMITYASFLHRKNDLNNNATITGLADLGTSFVAGIAVFATLGAMSFATQQQGHYIPVTTVAKGGPGLAFVAFPYALAQLPYSAWFGIVFFVALLTLGIDSAFSITETVLASLVDKTGWDRNKTLIGMTIVGFVLGLVYCTRGGLYWIGAIDDFINGWDGIILMGLLECVILGWAYRLKRLREHANERSDWTLGWWWDITIRFAAPIVLSALATWSLLDQALGPGGLIYDKSGTLQVPKLVSLIVAGIVPIIAIVLSLIRSPGANTHAQHVGQKHFGRLMGIFGTVFIVIAIIMLIRSFSLSIDTRQAVSAGNSPACYKILSLELPKAVAVAIAAGALALLATVIGGLAVTKAEKSNHRPSRFSRISAGAGVVGIGCAAGLLLGLTKILHKPPASAAKVKEVAGAVEHLDHLTAPALIVLTCMLSALIIGLAWCFYRAMKAASGEQPVQPAENLNDES